MYRMNGRPPVPQCDRRVARLAGRPDPRLGAEPGITVTLETWDDRLCFHPHLHCLVTGGGPDSGG